MQIISIKNKPLSTRKWSCDKQNIKNIKLVDRHNMSIKKIIQQNEPKHYDNQNNKIEQLQAKTKHKQAKPFISTNSNQNSLQKIKKYSKILQINSPRLMNEIHINNNNSLSKNNVNNHMKYKQQQIQQYQQQQKKYKINNINLEQLYHHENIKIHSFINNNNKQQNINHNPSHFYPINSSQSLNKLSRLQKFLNNNNNNINNNNNEKLQQYLNTKNQRKNKILNKAKQLGRINFDKFIKQTTIKKNNLHIHRFYKDNLKYLQEQSKNQQNKYQNITINNNHNNNNNNNNQQQQINLDHLLSYSIPIISSFKIKNQNMSLNDYKKQKNTKKTYLKLNRIHTQPLSLQQQNQQYQKISLSQKLSLQRQQKFQIPQKNETKLQKKQSKSVNPKQLKRILTQINQKIKLNRKHSTNSNTISLLQNTQNIHNNLFINWKYKPLLSTQLTTNQLIPINSNKSTLINKSKSILLSQIKCQEMNNLFQQRQQINNIQSNINLNQNNIQIYNNKYERSMTEVKRSFKYIKKGKIFIKIQ